MDFVGGALPNVMFLIGMLAIGIGLGLEFKIVEVKGDLGRGGRIGALSVGAILIVASIFLYLTPKPTAATTTSAAAASTAAPTAQSAAVAPSAVPVAATETPVPPTLTNIPTLTSEPPSVTPLLPTATAEPTLTPVPPTATNEPPTMTAQPTLTPVPPTATLEPPSATPIPPTATAEPTFTPVPPSATAESASSLNFVTVPDIRNMSTKDADKELREVGLRRGEQHDRCSDIDVEAIEAGRGRIICQSPEPGAQVARGTAIDYVTADRDDD